MTISSHTVLLGLFDGLHIGHMSAVKELVKYQGQKIVYTFKSLSMDTKGERKLLMTDREKEDMLYALGVDRVISVDFKTVKKIFPQMFIDLILRRELGATRVICGENFHFGAGGMADALTLKSLCAEIGIETVIVPTVCADGEPVSTTRIRKLLLQGDISEANRLLGREYSFKGRVTGGFDVNERSGQKTLLLKYDETRLLPKYGVYVSTIVSDGRERSAVTNIGSMIYGGGRPEIETAFLTSCDPICSDEAEVRLKEFLREERRLSSVEELRRAVVEDIETVRKKTGTEKSRAKRNL